MTNVGEKAEIRSPTEAKEGFCGAYIRHCSSNTAIITCLLNTYGKIAKVDNCTPTSYHIENYIVPYNTEGTDA